MAHSNLQLHISTVALITGSSLKVIPRELSAKLMDQLSHCPQMKRIHNTYSKPQSLPLNILITVKLISEKRRFKDRIDLTAQCRWGWSTSERADTSALTNFLFVEARILLACLFWWAVVWPICDVLIYDSVHTHRTVSWLIVFIYFLPNWGEHQYGFATPDHLH